MAWNRSTENQKSAAKQSAVKPSWLKGAIAGAVIVLGAIIAALVFLPREKPQPKEKIEKEAVNEASSKLTGTAAKPAKIAIPAPVPQGPPTNVTKDAAGVYRYPGGARWRDPNRPTQKLVIKDRLATMFKHPSERHIAALLETTPGQTVFGTMMYGKNLEQDFLASLEEHYVYDKEESAEDRELRVAVEETKKEIKARMDAGENLLTILKETRAELQRLGAYREDLRSEIRKVAGDGTLTDQDVADFTAAANKMLKKEGLAPLKAPGTFVRQLMLRSSERKAQSELQTSAGSNN